MSKEDDGQEQRIAVTLKDGKVAEWYDTCRPDSGSLTEDEAAAAAQKYLADHGYTEMQEVSMVTQGGVCTFSFVSAQNGVLHAGRDRRFRFAGNRQALRLCCQGLYTAP